MSKYRKRIQRLDDVIKDVYGGTYEDYLGGKTEPRFTRKRESNYLFTLNTLQTPTPELEELFDFVTETFFDNLEKFIVTKKGYPTDDKRATDVTPVIETGEKFHRLHSHAIIEIEHYSMIRLDYDKIRRYFTDNLHLNKKIHLDLVILPNKNAFDNIKAYFLKSYGNDYKYRTGRKKRV
jgi:hypothetical protein